MQSVFDAYALYLQPGRHTVGTNMVQSEAPAELTQVGKYVLLVYEVRTVPTYVSTYLLTT